MKFNFVSEPEQIFPGSCEMHDNTDCSEEDCDGELNEVDEMILAEFFDTGKADDYIAGYFLDFDEEKKIVSIVGEMSEDENAEHTGAYIDAYMVLSRIELFSKEWKISWESEELIDEDGTVITD